MAKHKAASEVTVAPLFEKSAAEQLVDKAKMPVGVVIAAIVAWVLFGYFNNRASERALDQSWATVIAQTTPDPFTRLPTAEPEVLASLAESLKGKASGPWTRLLEAHRRIDERDFDGALGALALLRQEHPDHELVREQVPTETGVTTVVDSLEAAVRAQKDWESGRAELFSNPPPVADAPKVRLETNAGPITLALYPDAAPEHVANFLKHCGDGFYDGTRFHRVVRGFMIQGGDPNSREEDVTQWGQGGTDYTIPAESNTLYHFEGVLSAAKKPGEIESSGSQFFITTDAAHHLDGQHVVYGAVVEGMDVVRAIGEGALAPSTADRPANPVVLVSATVTP